MKDFNIYQYIEQFALNQENFSQFVQTLGQYFSNKFGVRECQIRFAHLPPSEGCGGRIPPARYGYRVKKNCDKLTREENPTRLDECIEFSSDVAQQANKARIIKLIAHEWMHFYDALFMWGELDINQADQTYRNLILQSHNYYKNYDSVRSKYEDVQDFALVDKLSAKEVVADRFAQDFLKEVLKNVSDEKLKKQIQREIERHNLQVADFAQQIKDKNIKEDFLIFNI